ncbi:Hypothetical protein HVR_LOCUS1159 [uncultured virus]|nr:Hypothetical protein HVR_LOCUS1159 [uncultured virus]
METINLNYRGKLVKSGPNSYLYKPDYSSDVYVWVHYKNDDDDNDNYTLAAECNDIDIEFETLKPWFIEANGSLDILIRRIEKEYGEKAPGFDDEEEDIKEWMDPLFTHLKWNTDRELIIYTWVSGANLGLALLVLGQETSQ